MPYFLKIINGKGHARIAFKCYICTQYYYDRIAIMKHITRHKYFACQFCENRKFRDQLHFSLHFKRYHAFEMATRKYKCIYCSKGFTNTKSYLHHAPCMVKFKCGFCNFETTDENSFTRHMKSDHPKGSDHCFDCSLYFFGREDLKKHVLEINDERFTCLSCGMVFHTKEFLDLHLQIFGNNHNCDVMLLNPTDDKDGPVKNQGSDKILKTSTGALVDAALQKR